MRELVAAAILELVDRLHQADIAFLNEIEELQAAVRVFFSNGDDQPEVRLDHLLLGDPRLALALLDHVDDAAELGEAPFPSPGRSRRSRCTDALDRVALGSGERRELLVDALDPIEPALFELVIDIGVEKRLARHLVTLG